MPGQLIKAQRIYHKMQVIIVMIINNISVMFSLYKITVNKHMLNSNSNKVSYEQWNIKHDDALSQLQARANIWEAKSGCHFSCIGKAKGIQIVASKIDIRTNIQLCTPNSIVCIL